MPTVSVSDVKDLTGTNLPDSIVEMQINMVISRCGDCLDASYSESEANFIALMAAAALVDASSSSTLIKSERAANGSSTTYQDKTVSQSMFNDNQYGAQALAFDTHGCLLSLFPSFSGVRSSGQKAYWQ